MSDESGHLLTMQEAERFRRWLLAACWIVLGIASLLFLDERPTALVKRNVAPGDMPWTDYGLKGVYVLADGKWIITRGSYLDRRQRYELDSAGALLEFEDSGVIKDGTRLDRSGGFSGGGRSTDKDSSISIKPGRPYFSWQRSLRDKGDFDGLNQLPADPPPVGTRYVAHNAELTVGATSAPVPGSTDPPMIKEEALRPPEDGFSIRLNQHVRMAIIDVMPGHWFYDVSDNAAYVAPHLYVSTDRQRMLHRFLISEPDDAPASATLEASARIELPPAPLRRCRIGLDPLREQVFLLRADGMRFWFDKQSLKLLEQEQLPGVWEPQYASINFRPGLFNPYSGTPLSEAAYLRLRRLALLCFIASLLGLATLWRPQWNAGRTQQDADAARSADA